MSRICPRICPKVIFVSKFDKKIQKGFKPPKNKVNGTSNSKKSLKTC